MVAEGHTYLNTQAGRTIKYYRVTKSITQVLMRSKYLASAIDDG